MSDEEGIRRTLALYCQTCDDGRFEEFALLFTEDASFRVGDDVAVEGRDAIRTFMEKAQPPEARGKHLCGEPLISVTAAQATASTDFVFAAKDPDGKWSLKAAGRYEDALVRTNPGEWQFQTRQIHLQ